MSLNKDDLREGGFEPLGVRKKIENAIEGLSWLINFIFGTVVLKKGK